ncbi:MAG TPA: hypothetical protein VG713_18460 [Pirellulales bacterium]|nr:hypothetical protein [Pirellulales bacterium]
MRKMRSGWAGIAAILLACALSVTAHAQPSPTYTISSSVTYDGTVYSQFPSGLLYVDGSEPPVLTLINSATTSGIEALYVGASDGNAGAISVLSGSTLSNSGAAVLGDVANSTGTVNVSGTGSLWHSGGQITVGNNSNGFLSIVAGGTVASSDGYVGNNSAGAATVSGAGSAWNLSNWLLVANESGGALNVLDAGKVTSGYGWLGMDDNATGAATVSGAGSAWTIAQELHVGYFGSGTLNVLNGAAVSARYGYMGDNDNSNGLITVSGSGSVLTFSEDLNVGYFGTGSSSLNVLSGGTLNSQSAYLAFHSAGAATVSGAGSAWNIDTALVVGNSSTGSLYVLDGGTVSSSQGYLANAGTATVSGAGSTWNVTNELYVGSGAMGALNVLNGGTVNSGTAQLGSSSGSAGVATISGAGSQWNNAGSLYVGGNDSVPNGSGIVSVIDGGTLTIAGTLKLWDNGTLNLDSSGSVTTHNFDNTVGTLSFSGGTLTINGGSYRQSPGDLIIDGAHDPTLVLSHGATTSGITQLSVGYVGYNSGTLSVLDGSTLTNTGVAYVGVFGASGVVNLSGGSTLINNNLTVIGGAGSVGAVHLDGQSSWSNGNSFQIGGGTGANGTATVLGGSSVTAYDSNIGFFLGAGSLTVSGANSSYTTTNSFWVGYGGGTGTVTVANGGKLAIGGNSYLADNGGTPAGSVATVDVSGTGSTWTNAGSVYIGGSDTRSGDSAIVAINDNGALNVGGTIKLWDSGALAIDTGGSVTATNFDNSVGTLSFNGGTLTINGGTYTQPAASLTIDGANNPTLVLAGGATISGITQLNVGTSYYDNSHSGTLSIIDGSTLTNTANTVVGDNAERGVLNLLGGSTLINGNEFTIGHSSGSGAVNLDNQSLLSNGGSLYVGNSFGTGSVAVLGGSRFITADADIGDSYGTGALTVSGANSSFSTTHSISVSPVGNGTVTVSNGGVLNVGEVTYLASGIGAAATVAVSGAGSTWNNAGSLYAGGNDTSSGGFAIVTVTDNGALNVGGTLKLWDQGTLAIDTGGSVTATTLDHSDGALSFNGGTLTVDGGTYTHNGGVLAIGGSNAPTFVLNNAYAFNIASTTIGTADGNGALALTGGATFYSGSVVVGDYAAGTLTVSGSSLLESGYYTVGAHAGAIGNVVLDAGSLANYGGVQSVVLGSADGGVGSLVARNNGGVGSYSIKLYDGSSLTVESGGNVQANNFDNAAGTLNMRGGSLGVTNGTIRDLTGTGTFYVSGTTTVEGGSFSGTLGSYGTLRSTGNLNFTATGGPYDFYGTLQVASGTMTLGGTLLNNVALDVSTGSMVLAPGSMLRSSTTTIEHAGSLTIDPSSTFSASSIAVASGSTLSATALDVSGSTLVNNGAVHSSVTVGNHGLVTGTGVFDTLNVNDGGAVSPGNSPGTMTTSYAAWNSGGQYIWQINDLSHDQAGLTHSGIAGGNPGWDLWNAGNLVVSPGFVIQLHSITVGDTDAALADFNPAQHYQWLIATSNDNFTSTVTGYLNTSLDSNSIMTSNSLFGLGFFDLFASPDLGSLYLEYTPVPEPSTMALGALATAALLRLRRRRAR